MHKARNGDFYNIKVRIDGTWRWARYLGDLDGGRIYVETPASASGNLKKRVSVPEDRVEWVYAKPGEHMNVLPNFGVGRRPPEEVAKVVAWRQEKKSWRWIGGQLGICDKAAARRFRKEVEASNGHGVSEG